jgi:hypothetical protein
VLDPPRLSRAPITPAGNVAGGKDAWSARPKVIVDHNAAFDAEVCRFGETGARSDSDTDDDQVRFDRGAAPEHDPPLLDANKLIPAMKGDAV